MSASTWRSVRGMALIVGAIGLIALPAGGLPAGRSLPEGLFSHLSQSVALRYWAEHPAEAPAAARALIGEGGGLSGGAGTGLGPIGDVFNLDDSGLPQNEESVSGCRSNRRYVLGGTNDYRGEAVGDPNGTGWHLSTDRGRTVANDGLLPPASGLPSGGDPVDVFGLDCAAYAASLAYDPATVPLGANGVAVYRSDAGTLAACPGGGSDPSCWPTARLVAEGTEQDPATGTNHFLDKEWMDVGVSGAAGEVVWVTYSDFVIDINHPLGFSSAEIMALRCDANLVTCTEPIPISDDPVGGPDGDVQFSDVTIAPDGRVYITWAEIRGELPEDPEFPEQTFIIKIRVAEPGSTTFGPELVVYEEPLAIPFSGFLHANDFRIATYPKNEVAMVKGDPRIFVVWDACRFRIAAFVCEEAEIKLLYSDDLGATWNPSTPIVLSRGNENYFPTIGANDRLRRPSMAVAWFTNRADPIFHNRQDVELVSVDPVDVDVGGRERLTDLSNEPEADPRLGGLFIGDYIEVFVHGRTAYVHYNANYRQQLLLGAGVPVAQQDNYLTRERLKDRNPGKRR